MRVRTSQGQLQESSALYTDESVGRGLGLIQVVRVPAGLFPRGPEPIPRVLRRDTLADVAVLVQVDQQESCRPERQSAYGNPTP